MCLQVLQTNFSDIQIKKCQKSMSEINVRNQCQKSMSEINVSNINNMTARIYF